MSRSENKMKRERATFKLDNQLSVLSRTGTKKDKAIVAQIVALRAGLSIGVRKG